LLKFTVSFELEEEQLRDLFEEYDVKFSKAKVKAIVKHMEEAEFELQDILNDTFVEFIRDFINEEWC
jgi:ribosomal protein L12E/L44/L45/RPP1/RPP2